MSVYEEPALVTDPVSVEAPSIVIVASAPLPSPPVKATPEYVDGAYPLPSSVIVPAIPGTSKDTIVPDPVPPSKTMPL